MFNMYLLNDIKNTYMFLPLMMMMKMLIMKMIRMTIIIMFALLLEN